MPTASGLRGEVDRRHEAEGADVEDARRALQRHRRIGPLVFQRGGALEQLLVAIDIERRDAGRAGERMRRVGVAVEQLDDVLGAAHEGVVDALAHDDARHRHGAGGDALGERDHVRDDAVALGRERGAQTAEAGDDLVEDQQDAVLVADLAQALEVALRRRQHAGRARHRLDDDGRDGGGVVQRDETVEIVGKMRAPLRARPW